ncbi:MAG TPA: hypothetical protein VE987_01245, partial [Polyangiaceae bacterium]|nr:hypothetical protein [Polyangiaceae bacterium]
IALCREAVAADPSPTNDAALARELLASPPPGPGEDDVQEAYGRARRAADNAPTDAFVQLVLCNAATAAKQFEVLDHCSRSLKVIDPDTATTLYFATLDDVAHDRLDRALSDLERAHQLGLPGDQYRNLRRAIEDSRWPLGRYGRIATYALVGWLAAGALLLGFAAILSGSRWRRFRARRARRGAMRAASNRLSVARIASCFG